MTEVCAKLRNARMEAMEKGGKKGEKKDDKKKTEEPPEVTFQMEKTPVSQFRTPADQAKELVKGSTKVCWSSHMADKARHVIMKADGKVAWDPKKTMGEDFEVFKKKWAEAMKSNGLKNYKGEDGWGQGDAFHLEIPESKIAQTDKRAEACMDEYARLTREEG
jgi:hypothetical protein